MTPLIDSHQHFWKRDLPRPFAYEWLEKPALGKICRDFLPGDLRPQLQECGIDYCVFVQTQHHLDENRWALHLAEENPWIVGVVGWVDLASPSCEQQLLEMKQHPKFVGVRHIVQDEPDDDFIVRPEVLRGLKVLEKHQMPFDLLFYVKHLKHAATLATHLPDLPMVIDHLAKPRIKDQSFDDWLPHLKAAAAFPNMYCKLSGMITEASWDHWTTADLRPYVQHALECFSPQRCMYGSDWPVCELAGTYREVHGTLMDLISGLSTSEQAAIMGGTAQHFYGLKVQ